ncbi:hypothetical protein N656DRAFT_32146 [Canariomyces notabilis]|uniref:Uncharacterized protein n=1 Tax=Canariomyces notabilis TaxID=2074819 RepID=A0AAN6YYF0_9PEZI|nr:hypothetical protein N656DRAFT_32146 [Canariomyces arenarius]
MSIPLYLEAEWGSGGKSYSRLFTFTNDITFGAMNDSQRDMYADDHPHKDEIDPHTAATPSGQPPSIETSVPPSGEQPVGQASIPAPSGLSSAAVIGIAVGCGVAGLGAIFALVWFLLRRRRQQKDLLPVGSYRSDNRAEDLMAEKEGNADVSPHSPYSDDGITGVAGAGVNTTYQDGLAHVDGPEAVAAGSAAAPHRSHLQDQPRSLTPYSDRLSGGGGIVVGTPSTRAASVAHTDEARVSKPSPTPGRATPRALTTPYAHLIEEGMTEEEIRRLEEEERQLDAAIEQAGRR